MINKNIQYINENDDVYTKYKNKMINEKIEQYINENDDVYTKYKNKIDSLYINNRQNENIENEITENVFKENENMEEEMYKDDSVHKKINIFLDLDQSIISGEILQEEDEEDEEEIYDIESNKHKAINFDFHNMENYYVIFGRPGLQKFLDYLFQNFNVSVWTAASKDYALFIIDKLVLAERPERKLDYVFFSYHCKISNKLKNGSKDLSILWDIYKLPGYTKQNTYILDDYDEVYNTQPENTLIAPPFYFTDENSEEDDFLHNLVSKLKKLRKELGKGEHGYVVRNINDGR
jgi:hypothetical protein